MFKEPIPSPPQKESKNEQRGMTRRTFLRLIGLTAAGMATGYGVKKAVASQIEHQSSEEKPRAPEQAMAKFEADLRNSVSLIEEKINIFYPDKSRSKVAANELMEDIQKISDPLYSEFNILVISLQQTNINSENNEQIRKIENRMEAFGDMIQEIKKENDYLQSQNMIPPGVPVGNDIRQAIRILDYLKDELSK